MSKKGKILDSPSTSRALKSSRARFPGSNFLETYICEILLTSSLQGRELVDIFKISRSRSKPEWAGVKRTVVALGLMIVRHMVTLANLVQMRSPLQRNPRIQNHNLYLRSMAARCPHLIGYLSFQYFNINKATIVLALTSPLTWSGYILL